MAEQVAPCATYLLLFACIKHLILFISQVRNLYFHQFFFGNNSLQILAMFETVSNLL